MLSSMDQYSIVLRQGESNRHEAPPDDANRPTETGPQVSLTTPAVHTMTSEMLAYVLWLTAEGLDMIYLYARAKMSSQNAHLTTGREVNSLIEARMILLYES